MKTNNEINKLTLTRGQLNKIMSAIKLVQDNYGGRYYRDVFYDSEKNLFKAKNVHKMKIELNDGYKIKIDLID